jgi:hypothetical protein
MELRRGVDACYVSVRPLRTSLRSTLAETSPRTLTPYPHIHTLAQPIARRRGQTQPSPTRSSTSLRILLLHYHAEKVQPPRCSHNRLEEENLVFELGERAWGGVTDLCEVGPMEVSGLSHDKTEKSGQRETKALG